MSASGRTGQMQGRPNFNKGEHPHVGRKPGTPNKSNAAVQEIMDRLGVNPVETMCLIVLDKVACSTCRGKGKTLYQPARGKGKLAARTCESCYGSGYEQISPELKGKMCEVLSKFVYHQLKAIDVQIDHGSTITEAFKRALARIEGIK